MLFTLRQKPPEATTPDAGEIDRLAAEGLAISLSRLADFARAHGLSAEEYDQARAEIAGRIEGWRSARLAEARRRR